MTEPLESGRRGLQNIGIPFETESYSVSSGANRQFERHAGKGPLGRFFFGFPRGWPGVTLFLLRAVIAAAALTDGASYLAGANSAVAAWLSGLVALAAGSFLLVGFLTPIAALIAAAGALAVGLSLLPACSPNFLDSRSAFVLAFTILIAIAGLGPGAFSVDARIFGRREIIIPPHDE